MTQTEIKVGPIRPTTGALAQLGGAAAAQPLGGGSLPDQVEELRQAVLSLQDQLFAQSQLLNRTISVPMLIASGDNHQPGVVPDPGSTAGTTKFLREDATFSQVSAAGLTGILPVVNGGTGTATGSITGTGDLTFTAGGSNKTASLISSGTGKVVLKPGTDSTTAVQVQNASGTALFTVDTSSPAAIFNTASGDVSFALAVAGTNKVRFLRDSTGLYASLFTLDSFPYAFGTNGAISIWIDGSQQVAIGKTSTLHSPFAVVGLATYASNALALAGGLTAGDFYTDGSGSVKVVF